MSCIVNTGYALGCRDQSAGNRKAFLGNFDESAVYSASTDGTITASTSTVSYNTFEQELETADFAESASITNENGSVFYTQTLTLTFQRSTASLRNQVKLLAQANLSALILTQNDEYLLMGEKNGIRVTEIEGGTGAAFGDLSGYVVTFVAKEPSLAAVVDQDSTGLTIVAN